MIKAFSYSLKESLKQVARNRGMSLASIFSITAMLLILAVVLALTVNIGYLTETVKTQFDTIEVFMLDESAESDAQKLMDDLKARSEVKNVQYITKEQAMEEFRADWGDRAYLLDSLVGNPLPNSVRITLSELQHGAVIKAMCQGYSGVEDIRFYADEVSKVLVISDAIEKGALVIIAFLVIVSIVVVSNTVKLTVLARRDEIQIMKCVGATNWFIRGPLLLEGVIIGFISAFIAATISSFAYVKICEALSLQAISLFSTGLVNPRFMIENFVWIFLALGISIGAFGSILSMRRFLQE
jgi:cell division transport system permease protein